MHKKEYCAGIIPLKYSNEIGWSILLVQHVKGMYWAFPKGHIDQQEEPLVAAQRELFEETNLNISSLIGDLVLEENYQFLRNEIPIHKFITYYPAFVEGNLMIKEPHEVLKVGWFSLEKAMSQITFKLTQSMIQPLILHLKHLDMKKNES